MTLTPEEIDAVWEYSGPGYRRINAFLRGEEAGDDALRRTVELIDSAIAKAKLATDLVLYRGIGEPGATMWRERGLRVGQRRTDVAFVSTSADPTVANLFSDTPPDGLILRIQAVAGTCALNMTSYSAYPNEAEYLLPRGTTVRVLGYDPGTRTVEAEVVWNG
jgi:hypothetical protein